MNIFFWSKVESRKVGLLLCGFLADATHQKMQCPLLVLLRSPSAKERF